MKKKQIMDKNTLIDSLDRKILSVLVDNAKTPFLEVAKMCNVSGSAIHQRVNKLMQMGVITGSHFSIDPKKLGFQTLAYVGVYLENARVFNDVLDQINLILNNEPEWPLTYKPNYHYMDKMR